MMRYTLISIVSVFCFFSVPAALAGDAGWVQARGSAWSRPGLSRAQARLMAERGAQVVASRNLLAREATARRHITPGYRHLSGVVRGQRYSPARYWPEGRVSVRAWKPRGW